MNQVELGVFFFNYHNLATFETFFNTPTQNCWETQGENCNFTAEMHYVITNDFPIPYHM